MDELDMGVGQIERVFDVRSELELIISSHQRVSAANCREP